MYIRLNKERKVKPKTNKAFRDALFDTGVYLACRMRDNTSNEWERESR